MRQDSLLLLNTSLPPTGSKLSPSIATAPTPYVLDSTFELLATRHLVLGLTNDGGYYRFGAKAAHPSLFESKGMGTGSALDTLFRRTKVLGLSVGLADPFCDIDELRT